MARTLFRYRTYNFVDKDPVIDQLRTAMEDTAHTIGHLSDESGVSTTTLYNWFDGETRRPQFATVAAVATAMGVRSIAFSNGKPYLIGYVKRPHPANSKRRKKTAKA
jgi:DNA-binding phage protein